jgi:hypothetical protein
VNNEFESMRKEAVMAKLEVYLLSPIIHGGRTPTINLSQDNRAGRPRGRSSSPGRVKNFLSSTSSRQALGSTQHPIQWVPRALSTGVKRPVCEADLSTPASAEVKKIWVCASTPPYAFMA